MDGGPALNIGSLGQRLARFGCDFKLLFREPGVTAQINPPMNYTRVYSGQYPGIIWNILWGIVWELPDYTPGYILGAPRVYPTSPDYTPSDAGWGIAWDIEVYSGIYYI